MISSEILARVWRQLHPGDNPLVRRWDRAENCLLISIAVLALLAVPVLAAIGSTVHAQQLQIVAHQQTSRAPAVAELLDDAPGRSHAVRGEVDRSTDVRATWTSPSGARHEGDVSAPYGAKRGSEVDIWLDATGEPVSRPVTPVDAAFAAIAAAAGTWAALVTVLAVIFLAVRTLLNRARYAAWAREWRHISSDSNGP